MRTTLAILILLTCPPAAHAWGPLGHKVIADIAWERLAPERRKEIADTLRRHPRFDEDFAKKMPEGVDEDRWIFQQAATWPDIARSFKGEDAKYNQPSWHYINVPLFLGGERALKSVNLSTDYPTPLEAKKWNVVQAVKHCQKAIAGNGPPAEKALAFCWLEHLVGDIHQPLHSTALFCDRFPDGDRGGNSIPTVQGQNLHSLWDGLLGSGTKPNDVKREVARLHEQQQIWQVDAKTPVEAWIKESHELCETAVYSPLIVQAVQAPGELQKINLPREYLESAGEVAKARSVAAGIRLAALLDPKASPPSKVASTTKPPVQSLTPMMAKPAPPGSSISPPPATSSEDKPLDHWLNSNGNVRHNSTCKNFKKTKNGRMCTADEGKPCGICGG